nr:retrovirus-related Pol polyprotein from transposon TNT 1-94 [Tanacetum cinerariifolium]
MDNGYAQRPQNQISISSCHCRIRIFHFGDDALPHPPRPQRIAKSQRSSNSTRFGILLVVYRSGLVYYSGGLSGKYTVLAVCQIVHCASGLSFLTASFHNPLKWLIIISQSIKMANLSEDIQCASLDTRPPILDRTNFASWQQRIRLYYRGKENGVNILKSIDEGPFQMGTFSKTLSDGNEGALHLDPERPRVYSELSLEEKERYNVDLRATKILLQGLLKDIHTLINHYTDANDIWDNVKMLMEGSELTKEDRESQLYDDFEHFR